MRSIEQKPDWVKWSNFGVGIITEVSQLERHFHDADEYWLVFQGQARILSEGREYTVGPGDILCTRMGDEHDVLEVLEAPFKCFFIEDELQGSKRPGHLHYPEDDDVPRS
jgi:mannose-6-phosphate isomerase-like protein (cupin superfamily)